ncbi:hypothetical protein [Austwickia chelonae]|uniref:hypothetical protein n=1 Tax=Austwickia chelonae TaxID=100225 RepID=UPI0013C2E7E7|nr:hypothetical protein [Austwickia chelonae]
MMNDVMVEALVAAVNGVAEAQQAGRDGSWESVSADVEAHVSGVLRRLAADDIAVMGDELGLVDARRSDVEERVRIKVLGLVTAALAA